MPSATPATGDVVPLSWRVLPAVAWQLLGPAAPTASAAGQRRPCTRPGRCSRGLRACRHPVAAGPEKPDWAQAVTGGEQIEVNPIDGTLIEAMGMPASLPPGLFLSPVVVEL